MKFKLPDKYTERRVGLILLLNGKGDNWHAKPNKFMRRWLRRNGIEHTWVERSERRQYRTRTTVRTMVDYWVEIDIPDELQALQFKLMISGE
jgi:hypothetical protein